MLIHWILSKLHKADLIQRTRSFHQDRMEQELQALYNEKFRVIEPMLAKSDWSDSDLLDTLAEIEAEIDRLEGKLTASYKKNKFNY